MNGRDDNGNGLIDEGFDGIDNIVTTPSAEADGFLEHAWGNPLR